MRDDPVPELKRQVGAALARELDGWRAADLCVRLGADRARVSHLRHGTLDRFSLESLIRYADRMGLSVTLSISRKRFDRGRRESAAGD